MSEHHIYCEDCHNRPAEVVLIKLGKTETKLRTLCPGCQRNYWKYGYQIKHLIHSTVEVN